MHVGAPLGGHVGLRAKLTDDDTLTSYQVVHRIRAVDYVRSGVAPDFDAAVLRGCRTPAGFVMLFDEDLQPIEAANSFLLDECYTPSRNGRWQNTQAAYADDLANWWTYLRHHGMRWDEVEQDDVREYAAALEAGVSTKTRLKLSPKTRARRVGTVEALYRWAFKKGYVSSAFERGERGRTVALVLSALPHVGGVPLRRTSKSRPKTGGADEDIRPFVIGDLRDVLDRLGPTSPDDPNDRRPVRDRLMAEAALYGGMRVAEVCGLTVYQILDLRHGIRRDDPWAPVLLRLAVTKGAASRKVVMPSFVVEALLAYVDGERVAVQDAAAARGRKSGCGALFLNGADANDRDVGRPVTTATAMRAFTRAVLSCGLSRTEVGYAIDAGTGAPALDANGDEVREPVARPRHTFHDLRHTFAVWFYKSELRAGNAAPWKKLQARLGHARLSTTMDIYLRHVETDEPAISDGFSRLLREQLDALD